MRFILILFVMVLAPVAHAQIIDFSVACQFIEDPQARQVCQQGNRSIQQQQREQQQRNRAAQQEVLRHQRQLEMQQKRAEIARQRQAQAEQRLDRQRTATTRDSENPVPVPVTPAYNAPVTNSPAIAPVQETSVPQPSLEPAQQEQTKTPRFWKAFGPYVLISIFTLALFIYLLQENTPLRNVVLKNKANPLPDLAIHYLMTFLPLAGLYYSAVYIKDNYPAWFYSFAGMGILVVAYTVLSKKTPEKVPEYSQNKDNPPEIDPHTFYGGGLQSVELTPAALPETVESTVIQNPEAPAVESIGVKNVVPPQEIHYELPETQKRYLKKIGIDDTNGWVLIGDPKGDLKLEENRKHKIKIHDEACARLFKIMGGKKNNGKSFEYFCAALLAEEGWEMRFPEGTGNYRNNDGGIDGFGWRKNEASHEWVFVQAKCTEKHTKTEKCRAFCDLITDIPDRTIIGSDRQTKWLREYIDGNANKTGFFITTGAMNSAQKEIISRKNVAMDGHDLLKKSSLHPNALGIAMTDFQWVYINESIVLNAVQRMKEKSKTPLPVLG